MMPESEERMLLANGWRCVTGADGQPRWSITNEITCAHVDQADAIKAHNLFEKWKREIYMKLGI